MYKFHMQEEIRNTPGLELMEDSVESVVVEPTKSHSGRKVTGVCLGM